MTDFKALVAAQAEQIRELKCDKDVLIRHNIELALTVQVLEEQLLAIKSVRQGTDVAQQRRIN